MFERTRIRLTAWYLLIIMTISLLFSLVIFSMVNSEFVRFERMQIRVMEDLQMGKMPPGGPRFVRINPEAIKEARKKLIWSLTLINLGIFVAAGGSGYFLAGRTLRPIKNSMDEQKRFISDSSHELRTPLTSLRSEIEVNLLDKNLTIPKAKKVLESNLEEVISLQLLSDRLLDLAQNDNTLNKNVMKKILVVEIINKAIKKTENMAEKKNITVKTKIVNKKVLVVADRLTEVFVILIDNAIKYSAEKSTIEIVTKNKKGNIEISIKDHGIGISKTDLPHIFDRFYRAEKSRSEKGYGLGLPIAKKIIESHNGKIFVESKTGIGSTFTVTLPTIS